MNWREMPVRRSQITKCLWVLICFVSVSSCSSIDSKVRSSSFQTSRTQPDPVEYRLSSGDRISVVFMLDIKRDLTETYRIGVGDQIRLSISDRNDLSGVYPVVPDGWIHLPLLEPLMSRGMTLHELRSTLILEYEAILPYASVTVGLERFNSQVIDFLTTLSPSQSTRAPVYETTVSIDGSAVFPQIGFVKLASKTLKEVNEILRNRYKEIIPAIDVTARLIYRKENVVTVLGEVGRPGSYAVSGIISLTAVFGLAQGWLKTAHLESVIVVQERDGELYVNKLDLERDLVVATQVPLTAGDMVFVPRSTIADINVFVDQYIRRNLPINIGVTIFVPKD